MADNGLRVSAADVFAYLGISAEADDVIERNVERQLKAADRFMQSAVSPDYPRGDPRAQELTVMIAAELYQNRGVLSAKAENAVRRIASDFMLQLRLEGSA